MNPARMAEWVINRHVPVILVIEGDEAARNFLVAALHWAGFGVVTAATGARALATVESQTVSLVVSGSHLRGLSGAEVLHKLREREARHRPSPIPFLLLAGDLDLSAETCARRLALPVTVGELAWAVSVGELVSTVSHMLHFHPAAQSPV